MIFLDPLSTISAHNPAITPQRSPVQWKAIREIHYRRLFVYGAFLTIISAALIASVSDYLIGNTIDVAIDLGYGLLASVAFGQSLHTRSLTLPATELFWIAAAIEFVFLYVHQVDFDLIFAVFIPLIAFITLPMRLIVVNLIVFYSVLAGVLLRAASLYPDNLFLHNDKYMVGYALAHFFMISFGFFYHFAIEESVKRLEQSNREKGLLLREIHHRVKNNLNFIAALLGLQLRNDLDPHARIVLEQNRHRIESIALLHNILYRSDSLGTLDTRTYLQLLIRSLIESSGRQADVDLSDTIDPITLPIDTMMHLGILVNELVTNSMKYAADPEGHVYIHLRLHAVLGVCRFHYCDHGRTTMNRLEHGFGYRLIGMTVRQLRGTLTPVTEDGLCYTITFPCPEET